MSSHLSVLFSSGSLYLPICLKLLLCLLSHPGTFPLLVAGLLCLVWVHLHESPLDSETPTGCWRIVLMTDSPLGVCFHLVKACQSPGWEGRGWGRAEAAFGVVTAAYKTPLLLTFFFFQLLTSSFVSFTIQYLRVLRVLYFVYFIHKIVFIVRWPINSIFTLLINISYLC